MAIQTGIEANQDETKRDSLWIFDYRSQLSAETGIRLRAHDCTVLFSIKSSFFPVLQQRLNSEPISIRRRIIRGRFFRSAKREVVYGGGK